MDWLNELRATAHHEAGHAAFALSHGRSLDDIDLSTSNVGAGSFRSPDSFVALPGIAQDAFAKGGKKWRNWKRSAILDAAEYLAGPYAELYFDDEPFPDTICYGPVNESFSGDVDFTKKLFKTWLDVMGQAPREDLIEGQIYRVEAYDKEFVVQPDVRQCIEDIAELVMHNDGQLRFTHDVVSALQVSRRDMPSALLDWP